MSVRLQLAAAGVIPARERLASWRRSSCARANIIVSVNVNVYVNVHMGPVAAHPSVQERSWMPQDSNFR